MLFRSCYDLPVNIQSLSALLAAIVSFAIGSSVVLRDRRQRTYRLFAVFCFVLCLWHITTFLQATLEWDAVYFVSLVAAVAIPVASIRFFRVFLAEEGRGPVTPRPLIVCAVGHQSGAQPLDLAAHRRHHRPTRNPLQQIAQRRRSEHLIHLGQLP